MIAAQLALRQGLQGIAAGGEQDEELVRELEATLAGDGTELLGNVRESPTRSGVGNAHRTRHRSAAEAAQGGAASQLVGQRSGRLTLLSPFASCVSSEQLVEADLDPPTDARDLSRTDVVWGA